MDVDTETSVAPQSSPTRLDEPDPRQSLRHVLAASETSTATLPQILPQESSRQGSPIKNSSNLVQESSRDGPDDEPSVQNDSYSRASDINPSHTMTVAHSRRNANGTIGSVYSGNKIRHLKKVDGIPLWRRDIQFSFLRAVFEDTTPVFTRAADGTPGHTFADIYIHAMARSTKTSKILREKLLTEREAALNMAMICLLVNVGRMNTTLNFFPEMRAQLRTYHAIPCLQAHQDPNAYKQLQDAPRLKSILKGSCEEPGQPTTIEKIVSAPIPRTNPVNLIFVLSQHAPKISEMHFYQPRDFFDLVIRSTLSSRSRAKAFLWLVWWYLESDFSEHAALNNPFGRGLPGDEPGSLPIKVPAFEHLTEEQANAENIDTEEEKVYGEMKRLERKQILEDDETVGPPMKKSAPRHGDSMEEKAAGSPGAANCPSDIDRTRSPSPESAAYWLSRPSGQSTESRRLTDFRDDNLSNIGRSDFEKQQPTTRLILKTSRLDHPGSSSPAPPGSSHPVLHPQSSNHGHSRRSRPETSHQKAVNMNRKMRIDNILHKRLTGVQRHLRRQKKQEPSTFVYNMMSRIINLSEDYDTDDEGSWGPGGLVPNQEEDSDFGGEALRHKKVLDRALRRLARQEEGGSRGALSSKLRRERTVDVQIKSRVINGRSGRKRRRSSGPGESRQEVVADPSQGGQSAGLDDLDLDLLGEGRGDGHGEEESHNEESGGDDTEDGDLTEDGTMDER